LLKQMNTEGLEARTFSKWEDGGYTNLVYENNTEYGNDYQVFPKIGYWLQSKSENQIKFTPQ
ncbi:MAG: hypothetical protein KDC90_13235, partial [Ignavibacteriae bacterium]|nr:hypothetical protein [Ignavibacteriota bacterium]